MIRRTKPVPVADPVKPTYDLVVLRADLLCLLVAEVPSERLELDFLGKVDFSVLNDFLVVPGTLLDK